MKERPILFSAPMVRAILAGRKTQTRRIVGLSEMKPSTTPGYDWTWRGQAPIRSIAQQRRYPGGCWQDVGHADLLSLCPYGVVGDRLWVRETWRTDESHHELAPRDMPQPMPIFYEADNDGAARRVERGYMGWGKGRPAIFMLRWMSRITLELTEVRVERLQSITNSDAAAEGLRGPLIDRDLDRMVSQIGRSPRAAFADLWDAINGDRVTWEMNPYVWVITFKRVA